MQASRSADEFLDAPDGGAKPTAASPGFLSSIASGLADLGRADAATVSTLGRQAAQAARGHEPIQAMLARSEEKHGLPLGFLDKIAYTESHYNPDAVSPKGAAGVMQFMPGTARQYGIDPLDPHSAIDAGGKHVRYLLDKYGGDQAKALAAYNWGEGNLDKALAASDGRDWRAQLPAETYDYLGKILGAQASGLPPELHGLPVSPVAVDQVRKTYQGMGPEARAALLAQDDTQGRIARAVHAEFQRFDQSPLGRDPTLRAVTGGRLEDRALGYRLQGSEPGTALSLAASDVAADLPGQHLAIASEGNNPMGLGGQTLQSSRQGLVNLRQMGAGLGAWASDVLGDEQATRRLMEDYQNLEDEAARLPAEVPTLKDVHSGGDLAKWATNAIYANLPLMLPSLASGGVTGLTARALAKRTFTGLATQLGEEKAAQIVANRIALAAGAGAGASSISQETGSIYGDIRQQTGEGHPVIALAAGVPAGLLDTLPDMMVLRKALGAGAARQIGEGLVARYGLPIAKQMLTEGATEGAQTAIEKGAAAVAGGNPFLSKSTLDEILESMAQGAVAGGVVGGGAEAAGQAAQVRPVPGSPESYAGLMGALGFRPGANANNNTGDNNGQSGMGTAGIPAMDVADDAGGTAAATLGHGAGGTALPTRGPVGDAGRTAGENLAGAPVADQPIGGDPNSIAARAGIAEPTPTPKRTPRLRDKPIKPIEDGDSILSAIAKLGGVDAGEAMAQGIDTPYVTGKGRIIGHGILNVFTGTGYSFDHMAENLRQYGFPVEGANDLLRQITDAISAKERGHASNLNKMAADHADTAQQMEQAQEHAYLSPGFEFHEDEYTPAMDDKGRHMLELATALNRLDEGAGDAIVERQAIQGDDYDHTLNTLKSAISARSSVGEAAREPGQGPRTQAQETADLFGNHDPTAQAVADLERQKAAKRNGDGQAAGELFPGAGQMDVEDLAGKNAPQASPPSMSKASPSIPPQAAPDAVSSPSSSSIQQAETFGIPADEWAKAEAEARTKWEAHSQPKQRMLLKSYGHPAEFAAQSFDALPQAMREDLTAARAGWTAKPGGTNMATAAEAEPQFSSGQDTPLPSGQTVAAVRKALGRQGRILEKAGLLNIVQRNDQLPVKTGTRRFRGLYHQGKAWMVADYIPLNQEMGVFLHEAGDHANMEDMLGTARYADVAAQAERILAEGGAVAETVAKAIPKSTPERHLASERVAYLVEYVTHADEATRATMPGRLKVWAARVLSALRAWFYRTQLARDLEARGIKLDLSARDLAALARQAVEWRIEQETAPSGLDEALPEGAKASAASPPPEPGKPLDENAEPEISRNLKKMTVQDIKALVEADIKGLRSLGLPLLGRRQIVELYGDDVPEIRVYDHLMQLYAADANELQHKAGEVADRWAKLSKAVSDRLADIMHLATATGVDPSLVAYVPRWDEASVKAAYQQEFKETRERVAQLKRMIHGISGDPVIGRKRQLFDELQYELKHEKRLSRPWAEKTFVKRKKKEEEERAVAYKQLHPLFAALPKEARDIFTTARDMYNKQWADVEQALIDRINRSDASEKVKKENIAALRLMFRKKLPDIYFPLARNGEYVIAVKKPDDSNEAVLFAESLSQAESLRKELQARYADTDKKVMPIGKKQEKSARDMVSGKFVSDVLDLLGTENGGPSLDALREQIMQMYLEALPDLSWAKHEIHRKNMPGYSRDARRAFASSMMHGASHLARIRYVDQLEKALDQAQAGVNEHKYDEGMDAVRAQEVVNEMRKRHDIAMNPPNTPLANLLTGAGFIWYMGLSPASAIVNLTQTPLVAYPVLGGQFGFRKSALALSVASRQVAGAMAGGGLLKSEEQLLKRLASRLSADELAAIKRGIDEGHVVVTLAHELAGVAQGAETNPVAKPFLKAASYMFHVAEMFNRIATLLAAHRLAVKDGYSPEAAYNKAVELTYDGHFDYSATNRPRVMSGAGARVLLLFKQYSQNMTYTLAKNGAEALLASNDFMHGRPVAERRKMAGKTFAGLMAMHGMIAGAFGLPLASTLMAAASWLWGDDDEPFDAEVAVRNLLADRFGKKVAEALVHGLPRAVLPGDLAGRVGLDHLWFPDIQEGLEGDKWYLALEHAMLGPVLGIFPSWASGAQTIAEGQWERGVEELLPKFLRDYFKASRYYREGVVDKTGIDILDDTTLLEEIGQAAGFSSARVLEAYEGRGAIYNQDKRLSRRRAEILADFSRAALEKDEKGKAAAKEDMAHWNKTNPSMAITGENLLASVLRRQRRIAEAKDGVALPAKKAGLRDLGRFANDGQ